MKSTKAFNHRCTRMNADKGAGQNIGAKGFEEEDRAEQDRGGWGLFRIFWVLVIIVVLYALSVGPVARLANRNGNRTAGRLLEIYTPLLRLANHSRPVSDVLEWYIDVWDARSRLH
jgi:hypothetical protein